MSSQSSHYKNKLYNLLNPALGQMSTIKEYPWSSLFLFGTQPSPFFSEKTDEV